jgi:hypothetical protein
VARGEIRGDWALKKSLRDVNGREVVIQILFLNRSPIVNVTQIPYPFHSLPMITTMYSRKMGTETPFVHAYFGSAYILVWPVIVRRDVLRNA